MKKTKKRLEEYWDNLILKLIPPYGKFKKFEGEIKEHFSFVGLMLKRIIIPLILFYVVAGFIFDINIFGSLIISLLVFIYSNFLPDSDFLVKKTNERKEESLWYERYFLLFFAPIFIFHAVRGEAKPIYSRKDRCFHNIKSIVIYGIFLFLIGNILWNERIKIIMLPLFGMIGYIFHLSVDGIIPLKRFKK